MVAKQSSAFCASARKICLLSEHLGFTIENCSLRTAYEEFELIVPKWVLIQHRTFVLSLKVSRRTLWLVYQMDHTYNVNTWPTSTSIEGRSWIVNSSWKIFPFYSRNILSSLMLHFEYALQTRNNLRAPRNCSHKPVPYLLTTLVPLSFSGKHSPSLVISFFSMEFWGCNQNPYIRSSRLKCAHFICLLLKNIEAKNLWRSWKCKASTLM